MRATEILREEHRVIKQVLLCLEKMAVRACGPVGLDVQSAREAIDFFRHFADHCHHAKEEACLFPLMEARGFSRDGGPTGVMLDEHEQGRALLKAMERQIEGAGAREQQAVDTFAKAAHAYCDLLHRHICKENKRLFPMADQVFTEEDQNRLLEQFSNVEHHDTGPGTHERYLKLADDLAERFDVPREESAAHGAHGCLGHSK